MRRGAPTYGIGRLVRSLAALLEANPAPDAIIKQGGEIWLDDLPSAERSASRS